jgi:hypothetical protein
LGDAISGISGVLKNVYGSIHATTFPLNTNLIQNPVAEPYGFKVLQRNFERDKVTLTQIAQGWLTQRIERVRILGREWLNGRPRVQKVDGLALANSPCPPPVRGASPPWEWTQSRYTRRLKNGDEVYVYPKETDFESRGTANSSVELYGCYNHVSK